MFRGAREPNVDYFDEFFEADNNPAGQGILKGGGLGQYENLREAMSPEGLNIKMACRKCGKDHMVTLEWEELFVCGANSPDSGLLLPSGWRYSENNGSLYPELRCSKCGADEALCPHVTPDECRRHVNAALSRGFIDPRAVQMWKQKIDMYRSGGQQRY